MSLSDLTGLAPEAPVVPTDVPHRTKGWNGLGADVGGGGGRGVVVVVVVGGGGR